LPAWLSIDSASGALTGTPEPNDAGEFSVELIATDASGATAVAAMSLTVASLSTEGELFIGTRQADNLTGTAFDDVFDGRAGADILIGREGNDLYLVTDQRDRIVEASGGGFDSVWADTDYTLPDHVEGLAQVGGGDHGSIGNGLGNLLVGNRGDNHILGLDGDDLQLGMAGDDTLTGGPGRDALDGGSGEDSVDDGVGSGFVAGGRGDDTIRLGGGTDVLAFNRGDGKDRVRGADGQDDTLSLGGGLTIRDVALRKRGSDLVVDLPKGDAIELVDWYRGSGNRGFAFLQIAARGNDGTFDRYDFAALARRFDAVLADNRRADSWTPGALAESFLIESASTNAAGGVLAARYARDGSLDGLRPEVLATALAEPVTDTNAPVYLPEIPLPPLSQSHGNHGDRYDPRGYHGDRDRDGDPWKESRPLISQDVVEGAWHAWRHRESPPPQTSPIDYAMGWARLRDRLAGRDDEDGHGGGWCNDVFGRGPDRHSFTHGGQPGFGGGGPFGMAGTSLKLFEGLKEGIERLR
jgi:hypothetical protein